MAAFSTKLSFYWGSKILGIPQLRGAHGLSSWLLWQMSTQISARAASAKLLVHTHICLQAVIEVPGLPH